MEGHKAGDWLHWRGCSCTGLPRTQRPTATQSPLTLAATLAWKGSTRGCFVCWPGHPAHHTGAPTAGPV